MPKVGQPGPIPNLGRRIFASTFWMAVFGGGGYFLYKYTADIGTAENRRRLELERVQGRADKTPGKQQMMIDTLLGKGPASLAELREITTQKRYKIADENTAYAVAQEESSTSSDKNMKTDSANMVKTNTKNN